MFRILQLGDPEWVALENSLPVERRDIHFNQRMLAPYTATYGWRAGLAVTSQLGEYTIQPFLIDGEGQLRHAYNFGGPVATPAVIREPEHFIELDKWAQKHGVTNQYGTLNPFLIKHQLQLLPYESEYVKDTVVMDLNKPEIRGTTRRLANKAQGAGYKVELCPIYFNGMHSDAFKYFYRMYEITMERNHAADHWRFSWAWFQAFAKYVQPHLLCVSNRGSIEAACLIAYMPNYQTAYYHFAGSFSKNNNLGINHMMVLAAAEYVKTQGARYLHLGGGVSSDTKDGLFVFKSGFSKTRFPIYVYRKNYAQTQKAEAS